MSISSGSAWSAVAGLGREGAGEAEGAGESAVEEASGDGTGSSAFNLSTESQEKRERQGALQATASNRVESYLAGSLHRDR